MIQCHYDVLFLSFLFFFSKEKEDMIVIICSFDLRFTGFCLFLLVIIILIFYFDIFCLHSFGFFIIHRLMIDNFRTKTSKCCDCKSSKHTHSTGEFFIGGLGTAKNQSQWEKYRISTEHIPYSGFLNGSGVTVTAAAVDVYRRIDIFHFGQVLRMITGSFWNENGWLDFIDWYWLPFCNSITSCPSVKPCGSWDGE